MDPVELLTEEHLASLSQPLAPEVREAALAMSPAVALGELLDSLPALPSPEVAMLGDYEHGLVVCRQHAHRAVLRAWLATVATPETSARDPVKHG